MQSAIIRVSKDGKYAVVLCPLGHLVESHKIDSNFGGSYACFELDGFHFRTFADWREVRSRVDVPPRTVPAQWRAGRYERARVTSGYTVVSRSDARATARRHALQHGTAGIWHADDSVTVYTRDGDKVRQRTYRQTRYLGSEPLEAAACGEQGMR